MKRTLMLMLAILLAMSMLLTACDTQGAQGPQGEQGIQGEKGDTGEQGPQGEQGIQGEKGDTGEQGIQGEKGDKGDTGADGNGISSITSSKANGVTTVTITFTDSTKAPLTFEIPDGADGEKGEQGPQGEQGVQGDKGDKGDTGAQGEKGDTGNGILKMEIIDGCLWITYTNDPDNPVNIGSLTTEQEGTEGLEYYPLPDGTYGVMAGKTQYLNEVVIPARYNGKAVTQILPNAFKGYTNLSDITMPDSVTSIGDEAFSSCSSLTEINYDGTVESWEIIKKDSNWIGRRIDYQVQCTNGIAVYHPNEPASLELDGDLSDWDDADCEPVVFDENNLDPFIGEVGNNDGFTARVTADDEFVYFAFDITDYDLVYSSDGRFNGDGFQIGLDFNGWAADTENFERAVFYSFGLQEDGTVDMTVQCIYTQVGSPVDYTMASDDEAEWREGHVKGATKKKADGSGWVAEFAISWETLYRDIQEKLDTKDCKIPAFTIGDDACLNMLICYYDHQVDETGNDAGYRGAWGTSNALGSLGGGYGWYPKSAGVTAYLYPSMGYGRIESVLH